MNIDMFTASLKRMRTGPHLDPERDWFVLIALSLIAFAVIVVWNASAFDTVAVGGVIGSPTTAVSFSGASFNTINTIFVNRAAEEVKYQTGISLFTDPSQ